ncbi:protein translocase subunit SecD [Nocardioides sp. GY 10127]|uniref:protein translocase subunit SecD n=1 Tax=Nocardioides sp. GY 10127 TaxID=2569762 RepID=UPI0010A88934|nr:protein translocase subunit SecD [Nocardioides sp. GY 10127]TIC85505.1 protein translocase subunit SecD [Nocardioides sp. GY 10127]
MATRTARPGRMLLAFFVVLAIVYGLVAVAGSWTPSLGLDLQGGTSITLRAKGSPSEESLEEARAIIDNRVNASGVAEAEVTTQGSNEIVVEIPGENRRDLLETVERTAQLRFRVVACSTIDGNCVSTTVDNSGSSSSSSSSSASASASASSSSSGNNRASLSYLTKAKATKKATKKATATSTKKATASSTKKATATATKTASATASATSSADASASASATSTASASSTASADTETHKATYNKKLVAQCLTSAAKDSTLSTPLKWKDSPTTDCVLAFQTVTCPTDGSAVQIMSDDPDAPLITCDTDGIAYLLSPAMIEGTELSDAQAEIPQNEISYVVTLQFDSEGTKTFSKISKQLYNDGGQFAMVLDGQVLSAPTMNAIILNGQAQISGSFTEESATSLATSLRYGSLPIEFEKNPLVETIGPSLAGDQLTAGLIAGGIGLLVVMLYCLLYYRGLGLVVIASLGVAAAVTYALILLLSATAGFTMTLPGIAGMIIAIGITADSFIVLFERVRDEMRDGKSMRVAVESGWKRARNTCLAADTVSLLAAVVLYIFAAGVVKGFAFALGLTTIVDLVVFFWFTKPMVSWLARFRFFNAGHRLSGLDAEAIGLSPRTPQGGNA